MLTGCLLKIFFIIVVNCFHEQIGILEINRFAHEVITLKPKYTKRCIQSATGELSILFGFFLQSEVHRYQIGRQLRYTQIEIRQVVYFMYICLFFFESGNNA